jgi:23S rRNA (cytidine1920-2'-O)/16S rRNA (cytidine1409-2'-O)-methyltransferase
MSDSAYVSRGGEKLARALKHFGISVTGRICADLGSHVGGFVQCLLDHGAARVYSVDTCYGTLAWKLRREARVVVMERTNAMHVELPEAVNLVTVDVGWTRQARVLPNVARMLAPEAEVLTLIKPHYEASQELLMDGVLPADAVEPVVSDVLKKIAEMGWVVEGTMQSPIRGHAGNVEVFARLRASG